MKSPLTISKEESERTSKALSDSMSGSPKKYGRGQDILNHKRQNIARKTFDRDAEKVVHVDERAMIDQFVKQKKHTRIETPPDDAAPMPVKPTGRLR